MLHSPLPHYIHFWVQINCNLSLKPIFHCDAKFWRRELALGNTPQHQNFELGIPTCWYLKTLKFALPLTPNPNTSQWNIGGVGLLALAMYISCIFHVYFMYISCCLICASFSALAMRELADAKADSSGIQA